MGLKIALDYDGTYTADTLLWDEFMKLARSRGHEVILTSNKKSADLSKDVALKEIAKIAAGLILGKNRKTAKENHGIEFDIWIDNGKEDNGRDTPIQKDEDSSPTTEGGTESNGGTESAGVVGPETGGGNEGTDTTKPKRRGRVARPKS